MVLLRHDQPDGTFHFDWMIEREPSPQSPPDGLITFRVQVLIDEPGTIQFEAERLSDHRPAFLDYQGPLTEGRGQVIRVAAGFATRVSDLGSAIEVHGNLGACKGEWIGRAGPKAWQFSHTPRPA